VAVTVVAVTDAASVATAREVDSQYYGSNGAHLHVTEERSPSKNAFICVRRPLAPVAGLG
jgi:hypothetical protein